MSTPDKIRSFAHLPDGWDYGNGTRASSNVIELALAVEKLLREHGCPETDCFPGEHGTIAITGYQGAARISMEIIIESYIPKEQP